MEEVDAMLAAGEREIARDELRWLLSGCDEFLEAHRLLGEMALEDGDVPLARGHFGYAYELALRAWRAAGEPQPIAFARPGNRVVFEAGEGLITSLELLDRRKQAAEVAKLLASWDPKDPLALAEHASRLRGDESPGDRRVCPGGS